jgi:metal transporter CNNM
MKSASYAPVLLRLVHAASAYPFLVQFADKPKHQHGEEFGSPEFWGKLGISVFLVLLGGVFSGYVV